MRLECPTLRLRFWRAPPSRAAGVVGFVVALTDEHGEEVRCRPEVEVKCWANGASREAVSCHRIDASRWRGSAGVEVLERVAVIREGRRLVEIEATASADVLGVRTGLEIEIGDDRYARPLLRVSRDLDLPRGLRTTIVEDFGAAMGAHVWNAGIALAYYLTSATDLRLEGRPTLEFGAGCGLASIVAARCGANVLATDRDGALDALRANCGATNGVAVASLDFGRAPPDFPATLAIAADVLYAPRAAADLATTLLQLPSLEDLVFAHAERPDTTLAAWWAAIAPRFNSITLEARVDPDPPCSSVFVYRCTAAKAAAAPPRPFLDRETTTTTTTT
ncbi:hypothetical protein CTAYLR_007392 [Chrysophaeum taylorii]|uniref:Uncharacterized protein n=1 Tax=Chrysophaeum taylorii TaxID=2483200 RepID=A0AAD7XG99_9STRA|nr:hypothetical protein CTAYLR_007392 [Chrysophaeum taylorii]